LLLRLRRFVLTGLFAGLRKGRIRDAAAHRHAAAREAINRRP